MKYTNVLAFCALTAAANVMADPSVQLNAAYSSIMDQTQRHLRVAEAPVMGDEPPAGSIVARMTAQYAAAAPAVGRNAYSGAAALAARQYTNGVPAKKAAAAAPVMGDEPPAG